MPYKAYWATNLGSGTGGIKKIPGTLLADLDICYVIISTGDVLTYWLDVDSGASESSPDILAPVTDAGLKRWLLKSVNNQDVTSDANVIFGTVTVNNSGIHILDTGGDHDLILASGEDLGQDTALTITMGDAARTITLSGNPTLADWFDQAVKIASSPIFVTLTTTGGRIRNTTRKTNTDSPYTVLATDEVLFMDTDGGAIRADLLAGVEGRHHKLANCGSSGNDLSVYPNGSEQLYGAGAGVASTVADGEVVDIDYNAVEGWW